MRHRTVGFLLVAAVLFSFAAAPTAFANGGQTTVGCSDGTITYSPTTLWPPNHKLQPITISFTQPNDDSSGPVAITVDAISSNEEPPGNGCGKPNPPQGRDWTGVGASASAPSEPATVTVTPQVRAERCGTGDGRTYTIQVTCKDDAESQTVDLLVTVAHNQ